jgi:predicted dehydrogenase
VENTDVRIAVIGCGLIGEIYVRALRALGHEVAAIVDIDPARARATAAGHRTAVYSTAEAMFEAEHGIDAVGISTPPQFHPSLVELCAAHGAWVLCEKPLALDMAGATTALQACATSGTRLALGFKMRFEPLFVRVKDIIDTGVIGQLRHLNIAHYQPTPAQAWARAEGITLEVLSHAVDLSRWLFQSEPTAVHSAIGPLLTEGGDTSNRIRLSYGGERDAMISGGWLPSYPAVGGRHDHVLQAIGETGHVLAVRPGSLTVHSVDGSFSEEVEDKDYIGPFRDEWLAFTNWFSGGSPEPLAVERDAIAVQRILKDSRAQTELCAEA